MSSPCCIGLDLGGTRLKATRIDRAGGIERFLVRPSRAGNDGEAPIEAILDAVGELDDGRAPAVALGVPGMIDPLTGRLVGRTPHLPHWSDVPLRDRLAGALDRPVHVENDANCAALAEHRLGAARGARVSITVTVGTGVGSGIVIDGRIHRGAHGGAGEIGHLPLGSDGPICRCGVVGCAEPLMSGSGLAAAARHAGLEVGDAAGVFVAAGAGDTQAIVLVDRLADRLAAALAAAIHVLDPDVVVVGGGVASAREALMTPLERSLDRYLLETHRRSVRVAAAELGDRAGAIGAGLLAWELAAAADAAPAAQPGGGRERNR